MFLLFCLINPSTLLRVMVTKKSLPHDFYLKIIEQIVPIAPPAARRSSSSLGSLPSPNAKIRIVIFRYKNSRANQDLNDNDCLFVLRFEI